MINGTVKPDVNSVKILYPNVSNSIIGKNIQKRRIQLHMTQEYLAEICGFSRSYLSVIERGLKKYSIEAIIKIANNLDVSLDYLAGDLIKVNSQKFSENMTKYYADMPKEKQQSLINIVKSIVEEYIK